MVAGDLFKLLEGTDDGAFVVIEESELGSWNAGAQKLFGYAPREVVGKTCYEALKSTGGLGARFASVALAFNIALSTVSKFLISIWRRRRGQDGGYG